MVEFTVTGPLLGGALIGLSASLLLLFNGRIAGISGILGGLLVRKPGDAAWRAAFLAGLLLGGLALVAVHPGAFFAGAGAAGGVGGRTLGLVAAAGLLVGYGARLGSGCTSGHGVCGLSRLSVRSLAATATFMATAAVTVAFVRHVLGAAR
ncbi:YeeE/YedE family protein [Sorangium sp. So ce131]|uniref:YeeE/YedE family protein n=1 Tax=Sorangium sp. So ce131 TaxID=3133282 RepID=UPI003F61AD7C